MAVIVLKRQTGRAHTADLLSSDTAEIPGKLVISGSALSGTEVLRVQGETLLEGTVHGTLNGTGLVIGVAGASASTGSALQIASFTTTQRGNLSTANGTAGMEIYNTTLTRFQNSNGLRWGDESSNNFQATVDPTTSNDSTQGYLEGSFWFNTTTKVMWTCVDSTSSAAVWTIVTVLDSGGVLRSNVFTPNPNDKGTTTLGDLMAYPSNGSPQSAGDIQYARVWLTKDRVISNMQTYINSGANGTRQIRLGLYDQATPTSNTGTPNNRVAQTAADTPPNATTGFRTVALTATYTVTASGYYWIAIITDSGAVNFAVSSTYRASYLPVRRESGTGVTLPSASGTLTNPSSAVIYAGALE